MADETCEFCGSDQNLEDHHIVPMKLPMCKECHHELHRYYDKSRVAQPMVYNPKTKRFEKRSAVEMAKAYISAYEQWLSEKEKR